MGCSTCGQMRGRVAQAVKTGDVKTAARETARGFGMMTGLLPKGALPKPSTPGPNRGGK